MEKKRKKNAMLVRLGFPAIDQTRSYNAGAKFEEFQKLVESAGNEKLTDLTALAREYILGLNHIFDNREVSSMVLQEFDFPMYLREMGDRGVFEKYQNMQGKLMMMDVMYIARHLWEHTTQHGKLQTGDDLRKAWPLIYEEDMKRTPIEVFNDLHAIA